MNPRFVLLLALTGSISCGLQSNSEHYGSYTFDSQSETVDTARYALDHLIVFDQDEVSGLTLVYLFSGDLAGADLGLRDLEHISDQFGPPASIEFQLPLSFFTSQPIEVDGRSIALSSGDTSLTNLAQLNDDGLFQSGASRWLRSTSQGVATYFGFFETALWGDNLTLQGFDELSIGPLLTLATNLNVASTDDNNLSVSWDTPAPGDYVAVELMQTVTDIETDVPVEVSVLTTQAPQPPSYEATTDLIAEAHEKCCWDAAKNLSARLTQTGRLYISGPSGAIAVIHRANTSQSIDAADWVDQIRATEQPSYCDAYR